MTCWNAVTDQDRWSVNFQALEQHVGLLFVLWQSRYEELVRTSKVTQSLVSALFVLSSRLLRSVNGCLASVTMTAAPARSRSRTPERRRVDESCPFLLCDFCGCVCVWKAGKWRVYDLCDL